MNTIDLIEDTCLFGGTVPNERIEEVRSFLNKAKSEALNMHVINCSAEEAITLFKFYEEESCEMAGGIRHHVNSEYLEQYKTIENWLKNRHKKYMPKKS